MPLKPLVASGLASGLWACLVAPCWAQAIVASPPMDATPSLPGLRERRLQPIHTVDFHDLGRLQQLNLRNLPGGGRLNISPLYLRQQLPIRLAASLRARPQLGILLAEQGRLLELPEGIVLQSAIQFRLNPAACASARERQQLRNLGVSCFQPTQRSADQIFSAPDSARFIADPGARQWAISQYNQRSALARQRFSERLLQARLSLQQPGLSARGIPVEQLRQASEIEFTNTLLNRSVVVSQDAIYVPRAQTQNFEQLKRFGRSLQGGQAASASRQQQTLRGKRLLLEDSLFLTGFTFGKDFEWSKRVSVSIDWCWVGCTETYYLEPYANFGYGLGLRLPILVSGTSVQVDSSRGPGQASLSLRLDGINASLEQYRQLFALADHHKPDGYPLYEGQELVAQLKAQAGIRMDLPIYGYDDIRIVDFKLDLTDQLKGAMANGQWTPPTPGQPGLEGVLWLDSVDLLAGQGNIGVAGAKLTPGIKLGLQATALQLQLTDTSPGGASQIINGGREVRVPLKVVNNRASFSLSDPEYALAFQITPGIKAVAWIDLVAWEDEWEWPIWFPDYAITIPADGLRFGCHENTPCRRDVQIDLATGQSQQQGSAVRPPTDRGLSAKPRAGESWGNWGSPGRWGRCPEGHYLYAYRQKVESPQGDGDDSGLNGLEFACSQAAFNWGVRSRSQWPPNALYSDGRIHHLELSSSPWGSWSEWVICPDHSFITGFRLKQEAKQGKGDDTAATAFQAYCSTGRPGDGGWLRANNDGPWGQWSAPVKTKPGYALNAVRLRIEAPQGSGDDTAVNNVEFEGQALPSP